MEDDPSDLYQQPRTFADSVVSLAGHLVGTAFIFAVLIALTWLLTCLFRWLDSIEKFQPEVLVFVARCEVWLVYADSILCSIVLIAGAWRFVIDVTARRETR